MSKISERTSALLVIGICAIVLILVIGGCQQMAIKEAKEQEERNKFHDSQAQEYVKQYPELLEPLYKVMKIDGIISHDEMIIIKKKALAIASDDLWKY